MSKHHHVQITCPKCHTLINVEDVLGTQVEERLRKEMDADFLAKIQEVHSREEQLKMERVAFDEKKKMENELFQKRLNDELEKQSKTLAEKAMTDAQVKITSLQKQLDESAKQNLQLQQKELELIRISQELKNKDETHRLAMERAMLEQQQRIKEEEAKKTQSTIEQREREWKIKEEQQLKKLEDMKAKLEQGSMQLQGEAMELLLEELLRTTYPYDDIQEVGKGVKGADIIQSVINTLQQNCGTIIYESKKTKEFSAEWIEKLKADMRTQGADIAVLVTQAMPKGWNHFGLKEGVWICGYKDVIPLTTVLRDGLIKVHQAIATQENKGDKMQLLYHYLTGNEFMQHVQAIVEGFSSMKNALDTEKRAMEKIWKEREKQIEKVIINTSQMYGSIKGIAGNSLTSISQLELGDGA